MFYLNIHVGVYPHPQTSLFNIFPCTFCSQSSGLLGGRSCLLDIYRFYLFHAPRSQKLLRRGQIDHMLIIVQRRPLFPQLLLSFIFKQTSVCFQSNFRPPVGLQHRPEKQSKEVARTFHPILRLFLYPLIPEQKLGYFCRRRCDLKDDLWSRFGGALLLQPYPQRLHRERTDLLPYLIFQNRPTGPARKI